MSLPETDLMLDVSGVACPMPLLKTRQALRQLAPGKTLLVIATDVGSLRDIPAWVGQSCHELVRHWQEEERFLFVIRVGQGEVG